MKTALPSILLATLLLAAAAPGLAASGEVTVNGATSVTEMMQRKQEHQFRERLVAESRWDEVRQLDAAMATQLRDEQDNRYSQSNKALNRGSQAAKKGDVELLNECDTEKLRL
jgi:hypothetical protein